MKKQIKTVLSLLLALLMMVPCVTAGFATDTTASLYRLYGDGMLFKQNSEAVFAGTAKPSSTVSCKITNDDGTVISSAESKTGIDGCFSVAAETPEGGYTEYTVTLFENGVLFAELKNVVFGELWLASGQSNMLFSLAGDLKGEQMKADGKTFSYWLRFLKTPPSPKYNGSKDNIPLNPQNDIKGSKWIKGNENEVYTVSAVAFYFARRLQKKLDVPVGILEAAHGGTTVATWLSREAVDGNKAVKDILVKNGSYVFESSWDEENQDIYTDMSGNYNKLIAPLRPFRLSGMIWYQGESDVMLGCSQGEYSKQLDLLQRSYSSLFGYDGKLPLVFTQLASYGYASDLRLQLFNAELSGFQQADPQSRALVSVYDIPLTYESDVNAIHPLEKTKIGERMAFCAEGLVYSKHGTYSAATVESTELSETDVIVSLKDTGDGLMSDGKALKGFAVCGEDGIYLEAKAEIISDSTIRVWNDSVKNPCSVTYAVSQYNGRSNLFARTDGERLPVSPFITDKAYSAHFRKDNGWTDCDTKKIWRTHTNELTGFYDTWSAENAVLTFTKDSAFDGDSGLEVKAEKGSFSIKPVLKDKNGDIFFDIDKSLFGYRELTFKVRNNGQTEVKFSGAEIGYNDRKGTVRICGMDDRRTSENKNAKCTIPADGGWHTVHLDLTKIFLPDSQLIDNSTADRLDSVEELEFTFSSEENNSDLSIDSFAFSTEKPSEKKRGIGDLIRAFFDKVAEFFKKIFGLK